jgi:putative heme-binding domain-containing protein
MLARTKVSADPAAIDRLLGSTSGALSLLRAASARHYSPEVVADVVKLGLEHPHAPSRELFERFNPSRRSAEAADFSQLLAMRGDPERGRRVFFDAPAGATCRTCHRIRGQGGELGPDLSAIGAKYSRAELLEHIEEPSKRVDPPYVLSVLKLTDGRTLVGFVLERTPQRVIVQDLQGARTQLPLSLIKNSTPQPQSAMPQSLLRAMTPQEAADLLSFLESLK